MQLSIKNNTIRINGEIPVEQWPQFVEACNALIAKQASGAVPGSDVTPARAAQAATPRPQVKGAGDHLHDIIVERMGLAPSNGCGCRSMIAWMNEIGPEACIAHRDAIVGHLVNQGERTLQGVRKVAINLPGGRTIARHVASGMFDEAMRRARADAGEP